MAIGTGANFKIYPEQLQAGIVETLVQNTNLFNAASQNAIVLGTQSHRGDYLANAFFKNTNGLFQRRDITSLADVTDESMNQEEMIWVKLNRRIGPIAQTRDSFRKIMAGRAEDEMSFILGQQLAKAMEISMLDDALSSLVAFLRGQPTNFVDKFSGTPAKLTTDHLFEGLAKMGDASNRVVAWVMNSASYFNLTRGQVAANIDGVSNFNVATGTPVTLNRPVIVTDAVSLNNATTGNYVLGLVSNAAEIYDSEETYMTFDEITGKAQLIVRWQGESAHTLGIKGAKFDLANGGVNPTAAALATPTNWDKVYDSHKDLGGVVIEVANA